MATPRRMQISTLVNFVYDDEVLLPVRMSAARTVSGASGPATVGALVRLLICSAQMCVPARAQLSLSLPVKNQTPGTDPRVAQLFSAARAGLPKPAPAGWRFTWREDKSSFVLKAYAGRAISSAYFFPLDESVIDTGAKEAFAPSAAGFQLTLRKSDQLMKRVSRLRGVLVLADRQAYLVDVPAGAAGGNRAGS